MTKPRRPTVDAIAAQAQAQRDEADRALRELLEVPIPAGWIPLDAAPRERAVIYRAAIAEHQVARLLAYIGAREAGTAIEQALAQAMAIQQHTSAARIGRSAHAADKRDKAQRTANTVLSVVLVVLGNVPARGYHKLLENLWPEKAGSVPAREARVRLREGFQALPIDDTTQAHLRTIVGDRPSVAELVAPAARKSLAAVVAALLAD
jgi:hypothetical protein